MQEKDSSYLNLLFHISELADLVTGSSDLEDFLQLSVDLVAQHFNAPVCSIYLYNKKLTRLTLKATKGLKPEAVNKIRMKPGEGLVGQSFETLSIVREGNATQNPRFKYFAEAGEDPFHSFLCVPIKWGDEKIGVLAVQHRDMDHFDISDERAIKAVVTQVAGSIKNAGLLIELAHTKGGKTVSAPLAFVKGKAATRGYAMGNAVILNQQQKTLLYAPDPAEPVCSKDDFLTAIKKTTRELKALQKTFVRRLPESASLIFTAHFMILSDKNFMGKMEMLIDAGTPPCDAVRKVATQYIGIFSSSPHAYMKEKAQDVEDLSIRILNKLTARQEDRGYEKGNIAIATQVYPSDILKFVSGGIKGIILASGGVTSHVTILARSLQLPLIITEEPELLTLPENTKILMDGEQGNVYINPEKETIALFETRLTTEKQTRSVSMKHQTHTLDNERVTLLANINLLSEMSLARRLKAEGIGLYRSEFPFLIRATFPTEAEQYRIYKKLFDEMPDHPITIRTLDAGGEKTLAYGDGPRETNPELGLRSIRFSLKYKDIFEFQIRAILRAAAGKKQVRIMFPLISSIDEFLEAKQIVRDCMACLSEEQLEFNRDAALGMMVELPSVLETLDEFAREADFFSIGTNDFIQYMLAADRSNKMVADHYIPHHPAVNRGIGKIVAAAVIHGIDVSVCGEMAHEDAYIPFLLGLGIRSLSVDPQFLPRVQQTIMTLNMADTREYAGKMLSQTSVKGARAVLESWKRG
ncbi:phosphoenolpyruvate--protein phosphotransferase [Desulfobacula sp.]|uniref:phosphoenolpyruvate--protein phosphotransferase n=1 Tax=Desulfobacula sp. TaxID=2593537 RepID=UPI002634396D|nr:phosphoenolpyruvate--protein phosphotransferase [Desulfobacula sp.]